MAVVTKPRIEKCRRSYQIARYRAYEVTATSENARRSLEDRALLNFAVSGLRLLPEPIERNVPGLLLYGRTATILVRLKDEEPMGLLLENERTIQILDFQGLLVHEEPRLAPRSW